MFITEKILDIVVKAKDEAHALALAAFDQSHRLAVGALGNEIASLKRENASLTEQLKYERARGDALVDRLLERDARVAAVAPAAVAAAAQKDVVVAEKLRKTFESLADVADIPPAREHRAFEIAGGSVVMPPAMPPAEPREPANV